MFSVMLPWLAIALLVGLVFGIILGIALASALVRGHYSHIMATTARYTQPIPSQAPYHYHAQPHY